MLTYELLKLLLPKATPTRIELYLEPLQHTIEEFDISTPLRLAAFLAQIGHESLDLKYTEENFNYTDATRLQKVFPKYFKTVAEANRYTCNPESCANKVYASRMGNGDEASREGYKYRGRGLIQVTGKANYIDVGLHFEVDLTSKPDLLCLPDFAARSAGYYWNKHCCNTYADAENFAKITYRINGGYNGQVDRLKRYMHCRKILLG